MKEILSDFLNSVDELTTKSESLSSKCTSCEHILKQIYDFTKNEETKKGPFATLPELFLEHCDTEQVWQQVELQNKRVLNRNLRDTKRFVATKEQLLFKDILDHINAENQSETACDEFDDVNPSDNGEESETSDDNEGPESRDDDKGNDEDSSAVDEQDSDKSHSEGESDSENLPLTQESKNVKSIIKPSIVDDKFFKLNEMEEFLNVEEQKLNKPEEDDSGTESNDKESVNLFNDSDEDQDLYADSDRLKNPMYDDFFGNPDTNSSKKRKVKFLNQSDDDDEKNDKPETNMEKDEPEKKKSSYELREERLNKRIKTIEDGLLAEKGWQLKGEIMGSDRPQNSLLEEIVEFDVTTRPAPVMTEEVTLHLEDVIRQRIKDRTFDSVERKEKPVETPLEYKKKLVLEQEKSKLSLAQIYENEFAKQTLDSNAPDKEEEEPELHKEITKIMHDLFYKLDSLSNFHFTPKPIAPELKVVNNLPAVVMEEVAPVALSDATLLAPEEIKRKSRGDEIGKTERTVTMKKRERRIKKLKQKQHAKEKEKKELQHGTRNTKNKRNNKLLEKVTKARNVHKMKESGVKGLNSSTAFFVQLQDEVKLQFKNKVQLKKRKNNVDAKKIKL